MIIIIVKLTQLIFISRITRLHLMTFPERHLSLFHRPRRLRRTASLRRMVRENQLTVNDLIYPVFVMEGENRQEEIPSMPEIYRYSLDLLLKEIADAANLGINAIALFPLIATEKKDNAGTESYNPDGLVQRTIKAIKQEPVVKFVTGLFIKTQFP